MQGVVTGSPPRGPTSKSPKLSRIKKSILGLIVFRTLSVLSDFIVRESLIAMDLLKSPNE